MNRTRAERLLEVLERIREERERRAHLAEIVLAAPVIAARLYAGAQMAKRGKAALDGLKKGLDKEV